MSSDSTPTGNRWLGVTLCVILLGGLCGAGGWFYSVSQRSTEKKPSAGIESRALPEEVTQAEYDALTNALYLKTGAPTEPTEAFMVLGEVAKRKEQFRKALACFAEVPSDHPKFGHSARHQQGQILLELNRAVEAEAKLREFLNLEAERPQETEAHRVDARQRLRHIYEVQLRFEDRKALLKPMVERSQGDALDTMFYCFPNLLRWNGPNAIEWLENFWQENPDNLNNRLALGRYRTSESRIPEANRILSECYEEHPENLHVAAAYLECLRVQRRWSEFETILEKLPEVAADEPWLLLRSRGHFHQQKKNYSQAVECFQLALKADPANPECYLGLSRAYAGLKQPERQQQAQEAVRVMGRIQNRLGWTQLTPDDVKPFLEIARLSMEIGLREEALAVTQLALRVSPGHQEAGDLFHAIKSGAVIPKLSSSETREE